MGFETKFNTILENAKFNDYYYAICDYIREVFYLEPSNEQIESYLLNGVIEEHICPITDAEERVYVFKRAMAKQLIFDMTNGRGAMMRDDSQHFNVCPDTYGAIKSLGLYQRNYGVV